MIFLFLVVALFAFVELAFPIGRRADRGELLFPEDWQEKEKQIFLLTRGRK